jgi:hypothetical protein
MMNRKAIARKEAKELQLCEEWKDVPIGTEVIVTRDDGSELRTKTRSEPWMLGVERSRNYAGHTAVILVEGITGGYCLTRLRKVA